MNWEHLWNHFGIPHWMVPSGLSQHVQTRWSWLVQRKFLPRQEATATIHWPTAVKLRHCWQGLVELLLHPLEEDRLVRAGQGIESYGTFPPLSCLWYPTAQTLVWQSVLSLHWWPVSLARVRIGLYGFCELLSHYAPLTQLLCHYHAIYHPLTKPLGTTSDRASMLPLHRLWTACLAEVALAGLCEGFDRPGGTGLLFWQHFVLRTIWQWLHPARIRCWEQCWRVQTANLLAGLGSFQTLFDWAWIHGFGSSGFWHVIVPRIPTILPLWMGPVLLLL